MAGRSGKWRGVSLKAQHSPPNQESRARATRIPMSTEQATCPAQARLVLPVQDQTRSEQGRAEASRAVPNRFRTPNNGEDRIMNTRRRDAIPPGILRLLPMIRTPDAAELDTVSMIRVRRGVIFVVCSAFSSQFLRIPLEPTWPPFELPNVSWSLKVPRARSITSAPTCR